MSLWILITFAGLLGLFDDKVKQPKKKKNYWE